MGINFEKTGATGSGTAGAPGAAGPPGADGEEAYDWPLPGAPGAAGAAGGIGHSFLGYNTIGGSTENPTQYRVIAKKITVPADGWLTSIDTYCDSGASGSEFVGTLSAAVMEDSAGTPGKILGAYLAGPASILLDSIAGAGGNTNPRWVQSPLSTWVTAGDYWIAVQLGGTSNILRIYYDAVGSDRTYVAGGSWMGDWGFYAPTTTANSYSIRASFASPGGAVGPTGPAGAAGITLPGIPGVPGEDADYTWPLPGPAGPQGIPGLTIPGWDGEDGTDGFPGKPGPAGADGAAGTIGVDGKAGPPGQDGEDGDYQWPPGRSQLSITDTAFVYPGGTSTYLRADGTFASVVASGSPVLDPVFIDGGDPTGSSFFGYNILDGGTP